VSEENPTVEGDLLEGDELTQVGPLIEASARVIVPKKGKLFESDGSVGVCIIRPCVSRGRRLRGLSPIYTPKMLEQNAGVFGGWHMFMDHLSEQMVEAVRKRERSIRELGGRILVEGLHFASDFRRKDDADFGYRPGGVIGRAIPQPPVRAMLEADPEILHTSINAYPTGAREGQMWGQKGMLVEGIRRKPQGSVDWVLRGGAGGHVLSEDEALAVSLLEAYYDAAPDDMAGLDDITMEQLAEAVKDRNPKLHVQLTEAMSGKATCPDCGKSFPADALAAHMKSEHGGKPGKGKKAAKVAEGDDFLTPEDLAEALREQREELSRDFATKLSEHDDSVKEAAEQMLAERAGYTSLEEEARKLIEKAGLPPMWEEQLRARYTVLPSGPAPGLANLAESEKDDGTKVTLVEALHTSIDKDVQHAAKMIREAGGTAVVRGLGGLVSESANSAGGAAAAGARTPTPTWRDGLLTVKEGESEDDALAEMLREGAA
jgi:hypothetical protein